jgi:hypothetical protein
MHLGWKPGAPIEDRFADVVRWYIDTPIYDLDYGR